MGELGKLIVRIGTDTKELVSGLGSAQKSIKGFADSANKILAIVGFSLSAKALFDLGKATIELGDKLNKLAEQTGMSAASVAKLKYAAEQSETSIEAVVGTFRFLTKNMNEAKNGSSEALELFRNFHVEFKNGDGTLRNYKDVMMDVADRIRNTSDQAVMMANSQKLLGRGFMETIPFFKQGSEGLKKYFEEFNKFGLSEEKINSFAKNADALKDKWNKLTTAFQYMLVEVLTPMIPKMEAFTDYLVNTDWKSVAAGITGVAEAFEKVYGWVKLGADTIGTWVAGMSQTLGTLAGGGSMDDAGKASGDVWDKYLDRNAGGLGSPENPVDLGTVSSVAGGEQNGEKGQGITSGSTGMFDSIKAKMEELKTTWGDVNKQVGELWGATMEQITGGFGTAVADMIVDGKEFSESMKQLWSDIAKSVIAEIVKIIAQQIVLFGWQVLTGTVGSGNLMPSSKKKFFFFDKGGFAPEARNGMYKAANGMFSQTGPFGEGGIPAIYHPGEVVTPIDKLFDLIKATSGGSHQITIYGGQNDPQTIAEKVILEIERKGRRP